MPPATSSNRPASGPAAELIHAIAGAAARREASVDLAEALARLPARRSAYDAVARFIGFHGLAGHAYRFLECACTDTAAGAGGPEQALMGALRPLFLRYHAQTLANLRTLDRAAAVLAEEGIELLAMQGAALLAWGAYDSVEERPMADVDALVRTEAWPRAVGLLEQAGFEPAGGGHWLLEEGILDLHPDPIGMERIAARSSALPLSADQVWAESTVAPGGKGEGHTFLVPSRPMLWATGVAHLQKHSFSTLGWFVDLARLMSGMAPDEPVRARALIDRLRLGASGAVVGDLLSGRWRCTVPRELSIAFGALEPGSRRLAERASRSVAALRDPGLVGERLLWRMASRPSDRARLMWESVFPSGVVMAQLYPCYRPALRPWYMLRRVCDLAGRLLRA